MISHPFAGRRGSALRNTFARRLYADQSARCKMCGDVIDPDLSGEHCHVDHIRPHQLRPDLAKTYDNMQLVCPDCHNSKCAKIEARLWPDADKIAQAKTTRRVFGPDGWPI